MARTRTSSSTDPQILGIECPKCGSKYSNVIVTERRAGYITRQRFCNRCSHLWRTEEWNEGQHGKNAKARQQLLELQKQILALADTIGKDQ
jgi:transcriptional regulator NrdR family protein